MGVLVHVLFWKDDVATKDDIEVGDDDITKDCNHGL
jgi:hypothetical protein